MYPVVRKLLWPGFIAMALFGAIFTTTPFTSACAQTTAAASAQATYDNNTVVTVGTGFDATVRNPDGVINKKTANTIAFGDKCWVAFDSKIKYVATDGSDEVLVVITIVNPDTIVPKSCPSGAGVTMKKSHFDTLFLENLAAEKARYARLLGLPLKQK